MIEADGLPDALFFYQLLLPIHDTSRTVDNDPRQPFYTRVAQWSNMYAAELGILGSGYGHSCAPVNPTEALQWDGTVVMDGVRGGSDGAILRRMDTREGNTSYDADIAAAFSKSRWLEMKRVYKLCNNIAELPKKGTPLYNPAYKYDYIYDTIVSNVNALTLIAGLDLCGDESTFGFNGWGEAGTGLLGLIMNKPGVTRGGQIVMVSDVDRIRPRAYIHRHKLRKNYFEGGGIGMTEVKEIFDILEPLCGMPLNQLGPRPIFRELPHITWDNYFSGDAIMRYAATYGWGLTMTCRRDRLPSDIPSRHLMKEKTDTGSRSRSARFLRPIFCVKTAGNSSWQMTSFQSTSSTNIAHVNAVNSMGLYCSVKERGRAEKKRRWGIEMNESRRLYLDTYGMIDRLDHLIQNCKMGYRSWKYWHAPMLHAKAMAVVIAYDMYKECCEGILRGGEWRVKRPVSFHEFREKLAKQMLHYSPRERKYAGDEEFRDCTQQHKSRRSSSASVGLSSTGSTDTASASVPAGITKETVKQASRNRLCGDLDHLMCHLASISQVPNRNSKICAVCGKSCHHVCMKCVGPDGKAGVALHSHLKLTGGGDEDDESTSNVPCFFQYHNTSFFGLAKSDYKLSGMKRKQWTMATDEEKTAHKDKLKKVLLTNPAATRVTPAPVTREPAGGGFINWNNVI